MNENINISDLVRQQIENLKTDPDIISKGIVTEVGDGIARVFGLSQCKYSEMIEFPTTAGSVYGLALNLEQDGIGVIVLGEDRNISAGQQAKLTGNILNIPVGDELLGRVIDPLGNPLDGKGNINAKLSSPIEKIAPGVIERQSVNTPIQTGIKAIDSMIPIGRGQRELIIGDRQTGKTAIAVDTIINQAKQNTGVKCIYVAIGQKASKIAKIVDKLEKEGAMDQTIVIQTSPADNASLQYLAPYAGCAIGEYYRDNGQDALIVYDDLSKHAWSYRQISLLLRRPPGREAYPGDVFYLHSRLLERSARLSDKLGGGSLTALPIIETQAGDVSAYIPTNVISITDGQIYLESDLFYQGIRPALNVGLSVSRVGGSAQIKAMKKVAGKLRLELAQYRELASFAQFSTDLDKETKTRIERGKRITEILKQAQYEPYTVYDQVIILYAVINGLLDNVEVENIKEIELKLLTHINSNHKELVKNIDLSGELNEKDENSLIEAIRQIIPDTQSN